MRKFENNSDEKGFSLIEVTIAMAIASVALVTLLGLIPQGMNTMREAGDRAIMGRIHQQLLNEIQLTPFEDADGADLLKVYHGKEFFYDGQGEELSDTMSSGPVPVGREKGSLAHIYTARISLPNPGNGELPSSVGGSKYDGVSFDGTGINRNIRAVIVEVAAVGGLGETFDFGLEVNRSKVETFQTMIVKTGRDYRP